MCTLEDGKTYADSSDNMDTAALVAKTLLPLSGGHHSGMTRGLPHFSLDYILSRGRGHSYIEMKSYNLSSGFLWTCVTFGSRACIDRHPQLGT